MSLILYGSASAYSYAIFQAKAGEVKYATGVMLQISEVTRSIISEGGGSASVQFGFRYGLLTVNSSDVFKVVANGETVYSEKRFLIQYTMNYVLYPPQPIFDKGFELKAYYTDVDEGNIVYHQSLSGRTYITFEQRPVITTSTSGGLTILHILLVEFSPPIVPLALNSGPILLRFKDTTLKNGVYPSGIQLLVQYGDQTGQINISGSCMMYLHVVTVSIEPF
jgi:hypothetical protein